MAARPTSLVASAGLLPRPRGPRLTNPDRQLYHHRSCRGMRAGSTWFILLATARPASASRRGRSRRRLHRVSWVSPIPPATSTSRLRRPVLMAGPRRDRGPTSLPGAGGPDPASEPPPGGARGTGQVPGLCSGEVLDACAGADHESSRPANDGRRLLPRTSSTPDRGKRKNAIDLIYFARTCTSYETYYDIDARQRPARAGSNRPRPCCRTGSGRHLFNWHHMTGVIAPTHGSESLISVARRRKLDGRASSRPPLVERAGIHPRRRDGETA